jgi:putative endonuclease
MDKQPCVYILSNKPNGTLYIGVTSCLAKRVWEHKNKLVDGFSKRYGLDKLVWYETSESMATAIAQEKRMKSWKRQWKINLIESINPDWQDLYKTIL